MNLLEVQGLRKTYPAFRLEDVSFSAPEASAICAGTQLSMRKFCPMDLEKWKPCRARSA